MTKTTRPSATPTSVWVVRILLQGHISVRRYTLVSETPKSITVREYGGTTVIMKNGKEVFRDEQKMLTRVRELAVRQADKCRQEAEKWERFARTPTIQEVPDVAQPKTRVF